MSGAKEICASEAGVFWLKEVPSPKCDLLRLFSHTLNLCMDWAIWAAIMVSGIVSGVLIYFQIWRPYKAEENSQVIIS